VLIALFAVYRWEMRTEPFNSDDLTLYRQAVSATDGSHWLSRSSPTPPTNHHSLRLGMLVLAVPAIALLGPHATAYYVVPLVWALAGFLLLWWLMHREISPLLALPFALFHLALPFELRDSSVFLTDLPAAVLSLATLTLVVTASRRDGRRAWWIALAAGTTLVWAYLMRGNVPVLLAPALGILLLHRKTRLPALIAGGVFGVGVLAEQAFYLSRGIPWGHRWDVVSTALDRYSPNLPVYASVEEFVSRQFVVVWRYFGRGPLAVGAMAVYVLGLLSHGVLLAERRKPLLQALAAAGLSTWLVFSFAIYERLDDGIRAMAPPNFRYHQLFFYTSILGLCWLAHLGLGRARRSLRSGSPVAGRLGIAGLAVVLVAAVAWSFAASADSVRKRLDDSCGDLTAMLCAVDQLAATTSPDAPLAITIDGPSARLLSLFRHGDTTPAIDWRILTVPELIAAAQVGEPQRVLMDRRRVYSMKKFWRQDFDRRLASFEEALDSRYAPWFDDGRTALYLAAEADGAIPVPNGDFSETVEGPVIASWQLTHEDLDWSLSPHGITVNEIPDDGRALYLYTGSNRGFANRPAEPDRYPVTGGEPYTLSVDLGLPEAVSASIFFIQYDDEERIGSESSALRDGLNRLRVQAVPGAVSYRLALRLWDDPDAATPGRPEIRRVGLSAVPSGATCGCPSTE
jgi:hypothetical protein